MRGTSKNLRNSSSKQRCTSTASAGTSDRLSWPARQPQAAPFSQARFRIERWRHYMRWSHLKSSTSLRLLTGLKSPYLTFNPSRTYTQQVDLWKAAHIPRPTMRIVHMLPLAMWSNLEVDSWARRILEAITWRWTSTNTCINSSNNSKESQMRQTVTRLQMMLSPFSICA